MKQTIQTDREICEAATPGPWEFEREDIWAISKTGDELDDMYLGTIHYDKDNQNPEYIAHFNPEKVSKMLDRIEELEEQVEKLKDERDDARRLYCKESAPWLDMYPDEISAENGWDCYEEARSVLEECAK